MAIIGTIRKQSGLLIIIIGVALAAFVLGDFLRPRSGRQVNNIAEVMGEEISAAYYNNKYEQNLENQKRNSNKDNLTPEEQFRIRQQTYDQIVNDIVLQNEYDKLGISVTTDELFEQIQGENPHAYILQYFKNPETNEYDPEIVRNYIKQLDQMDQTNRNQWDEFVNAIKNDILQNKYKNLLSKGYFFPDTLLALDYDDKKTSAIVRLVGLRYTDYADSLVTVSDSDLKKYYDEYKSNYEQEESRDIEYVVFDVRPSAEDRKNIREDVFEIYADFKTAENIPLFVNSESINRYDSTWKKEGSLPIRIDSVVFNSEPGTFVAPYSQNNQWHMAKLMETEMRPDSMKATHILISYAGALRAGADVTRIRVDAKKMADSLLNVVNSNPSKMNTLPAELSDDPSAAENNGDLGWFADGMMVYPFNNAVLNNDIGDFVMVESQFGFHVIRIDDKLKPTKKVRVAVIDIDISPSQQTFQDYYTQASEFQGNAISAEAFDTLATKFNLSKRSATYLQKMSNRIAGIDYPRNIIQWAYIDGIGVGSVSQVFTYEDKYVVAMVTKVREAGIPSMEEIRETLEPLVLKELKGDLAVKDLEDAMSAGSLTAIAQKINSKVDTVSNLTFMLRNIAGYGNEANLVAKALTSEKGQLTGPVKGNNAAFAFVVDDILKPATGEDNKIYRRQNIMNFAAKVNNSSYIITLTEEADITDNRVMFY